MLVLVMILTALAIQRTSCASRTNGCGRHSKKSSITLRRAGSRQLPARRLIDRRSDMSRKTTFGLGLTEREIDRLRAELDSQLKKVADLQRHWAESHAENERLKLALDAHHRHDFPNSDPDYNCRDCGFDGTDV